MAVQALLGKRRDDLDGFSGFSMLANVWVYALLFIGLPLLLVRFGRALGRAVGRASGIRSLRWLIPVALPGVPSSGGVCRTSLSPRYFFSPRTGPGGFLVDQFGARDFAHQQTLRVSALLREGSFRYIEEADWPGAHATYRRITAGKQEYSDTPLSKYAVEMPRPSRKDVRLLSMR